MLMLLQSINCIEEDIGVNGKEGMGLNTHRGNHRHSC